MTGKFNEAPAPFQAAASQIRASTFRRELQVEEIPPPERIAPHALALAAGVSQRGLPEPTIDSPTGAGRFILMHDPTSEKDWGNTFRIVCYAQAPLEVEIGLDPFISEVAWTWLTDALDSRQATYTYASGTVTKTLSTGFGTLEDQGDGAQIELRASWTPLGDDFAAHAAAWSELICLLAGFPPQEDAASLDAQRVSRRIQQFNQRKEE